MRISDWSSDVCSSDLARFGVAPSSAIKWVQRHRATGSVAPGQIGGHKPRVLRGEHRDWLLERATRGFTLRGLVAELAERGVKVDYRQVWEFVHAEGLSFKKKRAARRTAPAQGGASSRAMENVTGSAFSKRLAFTDQTFAKTRKT